MHYVFGSEDSRDYDVLVIVDNLGTIMQNKATIDSLKEVYKNLYSDKPLNLNIATANKEQLTAVFKGTLDEVNNSIIDTYDLHSQSFDLGISKRLERDAGLKSLRAMRVILTFLSRTSCRELVKKALRDSAIEKHRTLQEINISQFSDLGDKNITLVDFYKTAAFQMGQSRALNNKIELYSKSKIAEQYPELESALKRRPCIPALLDLFKAHWLSEINPSDLPQFEILR